MSPAAPASDDDPAARVRAQYERFPYPPRDPAEERVRIIGTWLDNLDNLDILNHHCFRGERRFERGFRALVAGGGTGDGSIFLAHQLRDTDAEVVHLDVSGAAIDIARRRAAVNGYDRRIRFVQASLPDLPGLGFGTFDYVDCIGVLHHLAAPDAGLRALQRGRLPYAPENCLPLASPALRQRLVELPERDRQAIAELATGDLIHHSFYATRRAGTRAPYGAPDYVPIFPEELHRPSGADFVRLIDHHRGRPLRLTRNLARLNRVMEPGRHVRSIFAHMDGRRTFGAIFERVRAEPAFRAAPPDDATLFAEFAPWYEALESIERLVLRRADGASR